LVAKKYAKLFLRFYIVIFFSYDVDENIMLFAFGSLIPLRGAQG
jgi:hypothetical protein